MRNHDIDAHVRRGRQAIAERRFDDARLIYEQILTLDPAQPRAWLALSALAQNRGDFRESVRTARSAVQAWRWSGSHQFIAEVGMRLLVLGEYEQARDLIVSSDWSDPMVLRHSMGLVQYLGLAEAHEDALALADLAVSRLGNAAPASLLYARANALRYLGKTVDAAEMYERCLALDPLHAEAHWALAHHLPSAEPGSRVPRLRKALMHVVPGSEEAIYLHYALSKELDDADEINEAWAVLQTGSQLKRKRFRYDDAMADASYAALRGSAMRDEVLDPRVAGTGSQVPIFIVGLPRSGTTLLERMLGNHPEVTSAGELNDFPLQMAWELNSFVGEFPEPGAVRALEGIDFKSLGQGYLARTAWRTGGKRYLIDKLPGNLAHAGLIHASLPEARILCLRRNPMDSCFSVYRHLFSGSAYPYSYDLDETAGQYNRFNELANHWQRQMTAAFHVVEYEDLVEDPERAMGMVAAFCGLEFVPGLVDIASNPKPSATASASQIREGVSRRHVGQWERYAPQLAFLRTRF